MAYIGKQPVVGNFVKLDAITTSATATYNLLNGGVAYFPQTANNCIVSLNGVIQSPTSAYTISGSTIVFSDALTASDSIDFILVLGDVLAIGTPSDGTVGFAKVTSNLITGATAETSIAGGDSVLIYDDSAAALRKMTRTNFVSGIGGANTPAFKVIRGTSTQSIPNTTYTKIQFNEEDFDTASAYDNSTNYRFTVPSGQGGKYLIGTQVAASHGASVNYLRLYKNGTGINNTFNSVGNNGNDNSISQVTILDLVATDYIEVFFYQGSGGSAGIQLDATTFFYGFKLI
jgi:hypothetical protein